MSSAGSQIPTTWHFGQSMSEVDGTFSTSVLHGSSQPDSLYSGLHSPVTPVSQAGLDPVGPQDHSSTFFTFDPPFDPTYSHGSSTLPDLQAPVPWITSDLDDELGPVFTEDPMTMDYVPTGDEAYSMFSNLDHQSYTTIHIPQTLSSSQGVNENPLTTAAFTPSDISPPGWGIDQQEFPSENFPTLDAANPAVAIDGTSYFWDAGTAVVETMKSVIHSVIPSSDQQSTQSTEPVYCCGWKEEDKPVCGSFFRRASLSEHLSKHGIKSMSRNRTVQCKWVGCKKKSLNRESIARHVREVHLRLKRPSK